MTPDADTVRRLYRTMAMIRQFETTAGKLMAAGELAGFLHLSIGQEAIAAGVCDVLGDEDFITTTHRGHGHCIAKGGRVDAMVAELYGRAAGYCGGRSGSMHVADPAIGILGANAIVGACIPIAVGGAFAAQALGQPRVSVAFFGDGAVAQGVFHESLNLAALWRLPVVFVCENNQYAEMTPSTVHLANTTIADHAAPYGVPARTVDGTDVLAVREAALEAVGRARDGGGPTLLECVTNRWHGHFEGDTQKYRAPEELQEMRARDPLLVLLEQHAELQAELHAIDEEVTTLVTEATAWAKAQPAASTESLTDDVYRVPVPGGARS